MESVGLTLLLVVVVMFSCLLQTRTPVSFLKILFVVGLCYCACITDPEVVPPVNGKLI